MLKSTYIMMLQEYIIKLIKRCPGKYNNYLRSCNNYSALVVLVISTHLLKPVLATAFVIMLQNTTVLCTLTTVQCILHELPHKTTDHTTQITD